MAVEAPLVMVRYTVRPEAVGRNVELLAAVHQEVAAVRPAGLRYSSYQAEDPATFVEFVVGGGQGLLAQVPAFRAYRSTIEERIDEAPLLEELTRIGSYGFVDGR